MPHKAGQARTMLGRQAPLAYCLGPLGMRQQEDSDDSHDYNSTDSDDSNSSVQFELERIVSGPCKSGPNKGKYFIKWVGYDSDDNTWEPPAHISSDDLREYENEMQNSSDSDEDRTPIAKLVLGNK